MRRPVLFFLMLILLCHDASGMSERLKLKEPDARVLLATGTWEAQINASLWTVLDGEHRLLFQLKGSVDVSPSQNGFYINKTALTNSILEFRPANGKFSISGKLYRGSLIVSRKGNGMDLINKVSVENYLKSVVACEMDHKASKEALKAQTIAARTYTLFHIRKNTDQDFDIALPQSSQLYKGAGLENSKVNEAVEETRGIVMFYHQNIFPAFYHTVCGGSTVEASQVWPSATHCPEGSLCEPCRKNISAPWKFQISRLAFKNKLRQNGLKFSRDFRVRVYRDMRTQRVLYLLINNQRMMGNQLRLIFGPQNIRSTLFWVESKHGSLWFFGKGWGHGVGLCQYGAVQMASEGKNYESILSNYYPDSVLRKIY